MPHLPTIQLQAVATLAARRAAEHVLANLHRRGETNSLTRNDVKHVLDVEAQTIAEAVIRKAFPTHDLLGEEDSEATESTSDYRWIIDPIDGTVNFFHGLPMWCTSIAVEYRGKALAGCVYAPEMGKCYEATADGPALCNGRVIGVSRTECLDRSIIGTGADKWDLNEYAFRYMKAVAEVAQRPRILGAAALDICLVAEGLTDAFFESGLFLWDIAAGALILQRAGGTAEILKLRPGGRLAFMGTNTRLRSAFRAKILPMLESETPA